MALKKVQSGQNIAEKLTKSNQIGDNKKKLTSECLEIGIIIQLSQDTKLNYGNLMSTSKDTYFPAKNLIRVFYTFIIICVDTMPPHF